MPKSSQFGARFVAGLLTIVVLGGVWMVVFHNLPSSPDSKPATPLSPTASSPPPKTESSPQPPVTGEAEPNVATTQALTAPLGVTAARTIPLPSLPVDEEPTGHHRLAPVCLAELESRCEDVPPRGGQRRRCFEENETKLSPACQRQVEERVAQFRAELQHFTVACQADVRQFCSTVEPGHGRILQCLEEHYQEVSDGCYHALVKRKELVKSGLLR